MVVQACEALLPATARFIRVLRRKRQEVTVYLPEISGTLHDESRHQRRRTLSADLFRRLLGQVIINFGQNWTGGDKKRLIGVGRARPVEMNCSELFSKGAQVPQNRATGACIRREESAIRVKTDSLKLEQ